jgi:hypothetical protein
MTADNRRVLRMLCKAALLVSLPLAGFVWALPEDSTMLMGAGLLTLFSLAAGFGAEYLASATENDLEQLAMRVTSDRERRTYELEARDEKLRQFDRIVSLLTEQNHNLRAKLVSVQVDLQRKREALVDAGEAADFDAFAQPLRSAYAH